MKKILALVLALTLALGTFSFAAAAPEDVVGTDFEDAVGKLVYLGIIHGFEDGTYRPDQPVTRAEFAKIIVASLGVGESAQYVAGATKFPDVGADHWASGYVNVAVDMGIINGYPDGTFLPENQVTYAEAIKMIVAALGYTPKAESMGGYPGGYLAIAAEKEISDGVTVLNNLAANRGDIAIMIDNALTVPMMVQKTWGQYPEYEEDEDQTLMKKLGVDEIEGRVVAIPRVDSKLDDNELRLGEAEDKDDNGVYEVIEGVNFELAFGNKVTVYVKKDKVIGLTVESDYFYDALEDVADDELTLVGEDDDYDLAEDVIVWVNGNEEDVDELAESTVYNFAKVVLNDDDDVAFVDAYNWTDYIVVEEADDDEVFGYGDEVDVEDFTIVKDGVVIDLEDVEEGDIFFYNSKAEYAWVYNETVEGEIEEIFKGKFEVDGKSFDINNEDYDGKAVQYINEDGDIDDFDEDVAEQMEEEGPVVVFMDWAGNAVFITGDLGEVEKSTFGAVLYEDAEVYADTRGREYIELKVVNEEGEDVTYDFRLDDLEDVALDDDEVEVDTIAANPGEEEGQFTGFTATPEEGEGDPVPIVLAESAVAGMVVEITVDDSGDVVGLAFFDTFVKTEGDDNDVESGDTYIGGMRMSGSVPVFIIDDFGVDAEGKPTWDDEDVEATTYGELEEDVDISEYVLFHDGAKGLYLVITESSITKTTDVLGVVTQVRYNSDDEITRIKALVGGEAITYYVDDPGDTHPAELALGAPVGLKIIDANGRIKEIDDDPDRDSFNIDEDFEVVTRDREVSNGTYTWELVSDGYIYDITDPTDIEEMTFSELRNVEAGTVVGVYDNKDTTKYVRYILVSEEEVDQTPSGGIEFELAGNTLTVSGLVYDEAADYLLKISGDALEVAVYSDPGVPGTEVDEVDFELGGMIPANGIYKVDLIHKDDFDEVLATDNLYMQKNNE